MNNKDQIDYRSYALKKYDFIASLAHQIGIEQDSRVVKALRLISLDPSNRRAIKEVSTDILNLIKVSPQFIEYQQDQNPFKPYPSNIVNGPIRIGRVFNPHSKIPIIFGLNLHELLQNLLAFARAGGGKTNLIMIILNELIRLGVNFLVIDFKKDYRHLIKDHDSIRVFNWRNFKINPLVPPKNTHPVQWIQILSDIFFESFYDTTPIAAKSAFLDLVAQEYKKFELRYGRGVYPNLFDIDKSILNISNKKEGGSGHFKERLLTCHSRIKPLLTILEDMLDCQEGFTVEDILNNNCVIELDGVTDEIQSFLVNYIFYFIFTYRINNVHRGRLALHALIFDEAKKVCSKDKISSSSVFSRLVSQSREFGEAALFSDQMPSILGHAVLANVYTLIGLNLSATKDINQMAYAMGLNSEQRAYINRIPVGSAIVKLADRFTRPFLIKIPEYKIQKDVNDDVLERFMSPHLAEFKFKPRISKQEERCSQSIFEDDIELSKNDNQDPATPTTNIPFDLTEKEFSVLMDVKSHPFLSITERNQSLGFTNYRANRICKTLLEKSLVNEIVIKLGHRGRSKKYLELTDIAQEVIGRQNLGHGKGGFEHVYHQQHLQRVFQQQGYEKAIIEEFVNGKAVDIGIHKNDISIAVELAMTPGGEVSNFEKDYKAGWRKVWSVCKDQMIFNQVQDEWTEKKNSYLHEFVEFYLISNPRFNSSNEIKLID